ncbi:MULTISPECIES: (Fe-S)-binding protein [unclassified Thioalkalivibrio]|uniref:(Fe-S)-binding protein n=1 Tax=unclassified Thioalkalivibrio TaxID=2621013 RepID=UPI0009D9FCF2|nr:MULTISPECIES: (Fe-S)-binding protein [unclassified Thioalkalivibrio]
MGNLPESNEGETLAKPLGASDQPLRFSGLSAADQCVHCGLCLPHCPTYGWHGVEGDSPRGRLTLMQGLAQGRLAPESERLRGHLEGCLGCRSCEAVCPARVPFGALIDRAREILDEHPATPSRADRWRHSVQHRALLHPTLRSLGGLVARTGARLGAERLLPRGGWERSLAHTRDSLAPAPRLRPTATPDDADVLLFTGCMDRFFTGPDLDAALHVLEALGLRVAIPQRQVCCGALDQHTGHRAAAQALQTRNLEAFGDGDQPVIALDSGCEATLREHPEGTLGRRSLSLTRFLAQHLEAGTTADLWDDTPVRIALHLPCTQRNVTREARELPALLERLPGVSLTPVAGAPNCCGAGGTAMLTQPAMADGLGTETLQALCDGAPDVIISPNVGCSVHLRALAGDRADMPAILSPARFLARRLKNPAHGPAGR